MRPTAGNLQKLETLLEQIGYKVRYEKGHFQSGWCVVETKKVVVVNKFFDLEGRVGCLLDILSKIEIDRGLLSEEHQLLLQKIFPDADRQLVLGV